MTAITAPASGVTPTTIRRPIRTLSELTSSRQQRESSAFTAGEFLGHLLALGSVFFAGYLWLLVAA